MVNASWFWHDDCVFSTKKQIQLMPKVVKTYKHIIVGFTKK